MLKRLRNGKGVKIILVVSMFGIGSVSYIPTTYAAMNPTTTTAAVDQQNALSKLEFDNITFDQDFSPDVFDYTATVENSVQQTAMHVETQNPQAVVTINGQTVSNGEIGALSLKTGENIFTITVDDGSNPPGIYKLTVMRKQNSNNLLENIKLSKGELSPAFKPAIAQYNVSLPNETAAITITPVAFEKTSGIKINNKPFNGEGINISLPVGKSDIAILVTAETGEPKTYTLHVIRAAKQTSNPPSTHGNKPGTKPQGNGSHNPNQSKQPGNGSHSPNQSKQPANGFKNRNSSTQSSQNQTSAWKNGAANQSGAAVPKINKATLSSLTVSNGTWNKTFSKTAYTYHLAESNNVNTITLTPGATYSSSSIKIDGGTSGTVKLDGNKTTIPVVVTNGEDRKTYVLVFEKNQPISAVKTEAVVTADATVSSPAATTTSNNNSIGQQAAWNGRNNTASTSIWGRIVDSIGAFFKNIF